jgi:HEAT repeats/PQQ-like domain
MRGSKWARVGFMVLVFQSSSAVRADEISQADEKQLKAAGVGTDGPALLSFFKERTLTEADLRKLTKLVQQLGDDSFKKRQQASRDLIVRGRSVISILTPALQDRDPEVSLRAEQCLIEIRRNDDAGLPLAAVRLLAQRAPEGAVAVLVDFLPFADDNSVEEEILTALIGKGLCDANAVPVLKKALDDPAALRRSAAAYVLGRLSDTIIQAAVAKLLDDADAGVRLRAAQGLLAGRNKLAPPALIQLLAADGTEVGWRAEQILFQIAGDRPPQLPVGGAPEVHKKRQEAWKAWWQVEGAKADLAKIPRESPLLGYTLIAQVDSGKVWECTRDGKIRWTLTGLQGPIEVRPLPGSRLLITETLGMRVSERNMDGKILWEVKTREGALSAQRLPGGNTFIATNSTMSEVNRDGKEVYCHNFADLQIGGRRFEGGCKARDGRILATAGPKLLEIEASTGKVVKTTTLPHADLYGVEDLPGGHCLLASYTSGKVLELDENGKISWSYDLPGAFQATRLPNGNTLMTSHAGKRVLEVTADKKVVWEQATDGPVWRAYRR